MDGGKELGDIAVLIPAYEPDGHLIDTADALCSLGARVVVDDGSSEDRAGIFSRLEALGVTVLRHPANRGKGAALRTGLEYIAGRGFSGAVTADADGQHTPGDIRRVAELTAKNPGALVLGVRRFDGADVPWKSRAGNGITSWVFRLLTGIRCPDTQTGLRGIPAELFPLAIGCEGDRYEYEMNFLLEAAEAKVPFVFEPIETIYIDNNSASHFRPVRDSLLVYRRPLTFAAVAAVSTITDFGLFWLLERLLPEGQGWVFAAYALARFVSGVVNFLLNKHVTFRSSGSAGAEGLRYLALFLAVMLLSGGTVAALSVLPVPDVLIKLPVDAVLFVVNYLVERRWVFRKER